MCCINGVWPFYEVKAFMRVFVMLIIIVMVTIQFSIRCRKDALLKEQFPVCIGLVGKLDIGLKHCFMGAIYI